MPNNTPLFNDWQLYQRDVTSPQSYIDFGYYFIISASLQRRIWMGGESPNIAGQLYPNVNIILVGEPGLGKGRVITPVNNILRHWRIELETGKIVEPDENTVGEKYENYLYPNGPENITYEQLVSKMAKSLRRVNHETADGTKKIYSHSSMYFGLEELSSLLQKDTNKITDFLIQTYDCNDYRRETKTQGFDQIKKPCLTFIAGTTPAFMEDTFKDRLLTDGMTSRCWFIYELTNRFNLWGTKPHDAEQLAAKTRILEHLRKLAVVYGRVKFTPEADEFLKLWWEHEHPITRPNNNLRLASYYARKNIHVMKLAMIMYFSEQTTSFEIPLETAKRALAELESIEKRMHYALNFGGRNPFFTIGSKILKYMYQIRRPMTGQQLLEEFYGDVTQRELGEVMRYLTDTDKVVTKDGKFFPAKLLTGGFVDNVKGTVETRVIGSDLKALPIKDI